MTTLKAMTLRELLAAHSSAVNAEGNAQFGDHYYTRLREEREARERQSAILAEIERRILRGSLTGTGD